MALDHAVQDIERDDSPERLHAPAPQSPATDEPAAAPTELVSRMQAALQDGLAKTMLLDEAFRYADLDGDGQVTPIEASRSGHAGTALLNENFDVTAGQDSSPATISALDLETLKARYVVHAFDKVMADPAKLFATKHFDQLDGDHDGFLSGDELTKFYLAQVRNADDALAATFLAAADFRISALTTDTNEPKSQSGMPLVSRGDIAALSASALAGHGFEANSVERAAMLKTLSALSAASRDGAP